LDSKQFQVRERASAELAKLTDAVRPLLRKMMEDKVSPERASASKDSLPSRRRRCQCHHKA